MKRALALILAAMLAASAVACTSEPADDTSSTPDAGTESSAATDDEGGDDETEDMSSGAPVYPLEGNPTISVWDSLPTEITSFGVETFNDTPLYQHVQELTGVTIEWEHPPAGQGNEPFNLMIASGDHPDVINSSWLNYPGGPAAAFQNQILMPVNDYMDTYLADWNAYLETYPEIDKAVKTDDGDYFGVAFTRAPQDQDLTIFYGPMVRGDWLEQVGLDMPETIADWEEMLIAFRDEIGAEIPLMVDQSALAFFSQGFLVGAWETDDDYYVNDDGVIEFGPATPQFKEFLLKMNEWYEEGLIDPNFVTTTATEFDAAFLGGEVGATCDYTGSGIGKWLAAIDESGLDIEILPVTYPVMEEGETPFLAQQALPMELGYSIFGISARSENQDVAMMWTNWGYTEQGELVYNFGVEGESYEMIDGYPTYTDAVMNNPDWTIAEALRMYARSAYSGPMRQRQEYFDQYIQLDTQKLAVETWGGTNAVDHIVPPITPTIDEASEYAAIKQTMDTIRDEFVTGAIMGTIDIEAEFDGFVANLESVGLTRATQIRNDALTRYNAR